MSADSRRTPPRGSRPRGRTGPGRTPGSGRPGRAPQRPAAARPAAPVERTRVRPTGRLAILVLVFAFLAVAYASSLRAYLDQRSETQAILKGNAETQARNEQMAREIRRHQDPSFMEQLVRERIGYVKPGETAYVALDANGEPLVPGPSLSDPAEVDPQEPEAWWTPAWGSVELAGNPPKPGDPVPLTRVDGTEENEQ